MSLTIESGVSMQSRKSQQSCVIISSGKSTVQSCQGNAALQMISHFLAQNKSCITEEFYFQVLGYSFVDLERMPRCSIIFSVPHPQYLLFSLVFLQVALILGLLFQLTLTSIQLLPTPLKLLHALCMQTSFDIISSFGIIAPPQINQLTKTWELTQYFLTPDCDRKKCYVILQQFCYHYIARVPYCQNFIPP